MRHFRHHYYPRRRAAYGPRGGPPHLYTADLPSQSVRELAALPHAAALGLCFSELAMPRGGVRLVVICPDCRQPRTRLYTAVGGSSTRWPTPWPWVCRECAGLVYWRQYAGRRPEAKRERILALIGRYQGWQEALATWQEREAQHAVRAWVALTINQMRLDQMIAYHRRLDELNAAAHENIAAYQTAKRQSEHTATILQLDAEIRKLRAKQQRAKKRRKAA